MSQILCNIVKVGKCGKHPQADTLGLTHIYSFPVIFKLGEIQEGDIAVYIGVDNLLPEKEVFSFIWKDKTPTDAHRVVKAKRLRGIFSQGILMRTDKFPELKDCAIGENVSQKLGITKYEQPEPVVMSGDNESRPSFFPIYTEIENVRRFNQVLEVGEQVLFTEKIHGSCSSFCYKDNRLWISSHRNVKKLGGNSCWNVIADKYDLENKLKNIEGKIIFGEVYGNIQKGFQYDSPGKSSFIMFDVFDTESQKYLDFQDVYKISEDIQIPCVPVLYDGLWISIEHAEDYAEGKTLLGKKHVREGIVIRPKNERWNRETDRTIFKLISKDYLLQK